MESKTADVFAFGMLGVEVYTGKVPFEGEKDQVVVLRIPHGARPEMPRNSQEVGLSVEMWQLFENCWQHSPGSRPSMKGVVRRLRGLIAEEIDATGYA